VCEDIRDEVGNKKSIMGMLSGDIVVPGFPAIVQIAIYFEYAPDAADGNALDIDFRLLIDELEIAKGSMKADIAGKALANFILPRGLLTFDKESSFKMTASVNKRPEIEIVSKKIVKAATSYTNGIRE